jgi:3-oxoacyl-[acyl-carrier-protein] synthase-3
MTDAPTPDGTAADAADSTTATVAPDATPGLQAGARPLLAQRRGQEYTRILAYGAARGEHVGPIDSSDEWIRQRTGIVTRKRAGQDVEAVDLAEAAAREAIAKAGITPDQIGVVLVATVTHTVATPSMASLLAERIGATPAAAYDISAACAGYAYGIAQADSFIKSGIAEYVLVIGAEKLSDVVDPTDRSISFLLGDGAGAAVVGPSDFAGIGPSIWGSDGSKWDAIGMTATYKEWAAGAPRPTMRQAGQTVFRWAVWEMVKVAKQALDAAGVTADQLAAFVPHQANIRIIDEFAKQLGLPESVVIARDIPPPATPPPRASRSPRTACSTSTPTCRADSPCRSGSAPASCSARRWSSSPSPSCLRARALPVP